MEVTNHARAYDTLERLASTLIDLETVLSIHRLVKAQIDEDAGHLRTRPVYIRGASFTPAQNLPLYLAQWFSVFGNAEVFPHAFWENEHSWNKPAEPMERPVHLVAHPVGSCKPVKKQLLTCSP